MSDNPQILIDSLPTGKLSADNYRLSSAPVPVPDRGEVLVKTTAFAITAGTRAGLQGSANPTGNTSFANSSIHRQYRKTAFTRLRKSRLSSNRITINTLDCQSMVQENRIRLLLY